jgi:FixJ family two-component response regulator
MSLQDPIIAVVEDDAEMCGAIARLLGAAGYRAATFPSGEALLQDAAAVRADFFILDIQLPGISGFELRDRIAQCGTVAPVIFITASDDVALDRTAAEAGGVGLLRKPFPCTALLSVLDTAVGRADRNS